MNYTNLQNNAKLALKLINDICIRSKKIPIQIFTLYNENRTTDGTEFYLNSDAFKKTISDFESYCTSLTKNVNQRGRKGHFALSGAIEEAVKAFEYWTGLTFKKTLDLGAGKVGEPANFVSPDAQFVTKLMQHVDSDVTISNVRTALKGIPPRALGPEIATDSTVNS